MNRTEILEKLNEVFHDVFDNNDIVVTEQTNANDIQPDSHYTYIGGRRRV